VIKLAEPLIEAIFEYWIGPVSQKGDMILFSLPQIISTN
jgi:hypothetical protein